MQRETRDLCGRQRRPLPGLPAALLLCTALLVSGCGVSIPTDPEGSLDRIRSTHVLRVGASPSPEWVEVSDGGPPTGREPELVEAFAEHLGAEVEWTVGGEEHLVTLLEEGELDLAVGGVTEDNLWVDKVALTRSYLEVEVDGSTESHVMMVRMGENALQSELERWLDDHGAGS